MDSKKRPCDYEWNYSMVNFLWENVFRKAEREQDVLTILGQNILFRNLTRKELKFIEKIVHIRQYRGGEVIFRQNESGVGMYIIAKGSVEISVTDDLSPAQSKGREVIVTRLEAGDFFGELSLVEEGGKRSATAYAAQDSVLIGFFKPDLLEILERSPATGVKVVFRLAEVLGRRLKETTEKITALKKEIVLLTEIQGIHADHSTANQSHQTGKTV